MLSYSIIQVNHTMMKGKQKNNQPHERSCQILLQRKISKWSFWSSMRTPHPNFQSFKRESFPDFSTCLSIKFVKKKKHFVIAKSGKSCPHCVHGCEGCGMILTMLKKRWFSFVRTSLICFSFTLVLCFINLEHVLKSHHWP